MFKRIKDWWSLSRFKVYIKSDIKRFKKDAEKQAAVHEASVHAVN